MPITLCRRQLVSVGLGITSVAQRQMSAATDPIGTICPRPKTPLNDQLWGGGGHCQVSSCPAFILRIAAEKTLADVFVRNSEPPAREGQSSGIERGADSFAALAAAATDRTICRMNEM